MRSLVRDSGAEGVASRFGNRAILRAEPGIVRGAHDGIKPGVQRAKRANPRIATPKKDGSPRSVRRPLAFDLSNCRQDNSQMKPTLDQRLGCRPLRGLFGFYGMGSWGLLASLAAPQALCRRPLRGLTEFPMTKVGQGQACNSAILRPLVLVARIAKLQA